MMGYIGEVERRGVGDIFDKNTLILSKFPTVSEYYILKIAI